MTTILAPQTWPLRVWSLTLLGAVVGLAGNAILPPSYTDPDTNRLAVVVFLIVSGMAAAYVVERTRLGWTAAFALVAGLIAAGVTLQAGSGIREDGSTWRLLCAFLAIAIGTPFFQAWRAAQTEAAPLRWHIPYADAHNRAWTNLVLWFASFAFLGITWLLVFLLGALFHLIGIDAVRHLTEQRWFGFALSGAALGAGIGLLRDRDAILGTLQRVVTTILSVLAPALAIGLVGFVAALPFTGIDILWSATRSATPIMLGCSIAALILANAVIGDAPQDEPRNPVLRWSAFALSAVLPILAVIAAVSTGVRIAQYGLTPDRLWALTFTIIAAAYAAAYLSALVAGRLAGWMALVRRGNLHLGLGLCALALLLAAPLIDFGAISTRSQVARLDSGKTKVADFDWRALRHDYGAAGRDALARLAKSADPAIRKAATAAQASRTRYDMIEPGQIINQRRDISRNLVVIPATAKVPPALLDLITGEGLCWNTGAPCVVVFEANTATVLGDPTQVQQPRRFVLGPDAKWKDAEPGSRDKSGKRDAGLDAALRAGKAEVREVPQRQLFVDGKPVGPAFR